MWNKAGEGSTKVAPIITRKRFTTREYEQIVALLHQTVEVYRSPGETGYEEVRQLRRGDTLSAVNLPELSLAVDSVLG